MTDPFPNIPGYQVLKQMGQGGMATVYLAVQESFGRQVALKVMSDQLGKDDVWSQRFMHEARIVAQLSHSNIVPVFDVGNHQGRFYISMELLKGGKLDEKISRGLSITEIVNIICDVAAGLDYAGSRGFVHRDIKPDNIMFRDDGTAVILDFGIAKQMDGDSKMTKTGTIVGTTGYMSPEQAMGLALDERSDIYSLGIMFYELLTGHVPFRGDSAVAVLLKHVQEVPPPLPQHLAHFQPLLDKALAKKPEDRYKRGSEMIEDLQAVLAQTRQGTAPTTPVKPQTNQHAPVINSNDATIVMTPVTQGKKNSAPLMLAIGAMVISLLIIAGIKISNQHSGNAAPKAATNPADTLTPTTQSTTDTANEDVDSNNDKNKRVIARILLSARNCMKEHKYDCAKSKAESALDLDPENAIAKQIIANAEKAQHDAFSGDWNAK